MDKRRTNTKERFITQTIYEIEKEGYNNVSIRDLSEKLNVSSSTFYNHFLSKQELFDEVLYKLSEKSFDDYEIRLRQNYQGCTAIDAIVFFANAIMNQFIMHKNRMDFLFFSPSAIIAFKNLHSFENSKQLLLSEAYRLLEKFKEEERLKIDMKSLHIKCWSFYQGYILLTSSNVIDYNDDYIRDYLEEIICGNRFKESSNLDNR